MKSELFLLKGAPVFELHETFDCHNNTSLKSIVNEILLEFGHLPMTKTYLASVKDLDQRKIDYSIFVHSGKVNSLEQAAQERNQSPEHVIRSLLFRLKEAEFALILVAGPQQIPWKRLRQFFNQRRLSMANPEEVFKVTGYQIGTVSPFGISGDLAIYIESGINGPLPYSMGSGEKGTALMLTAKAIRKALPNAKRLKLFK